VAGDDTLLGSVSFPWENCQDRARHILGTGRRGLRVIASKIRIAKTSTKNIPDYQPDEVRVHDFTLLIEEMKLAYIELDTFWSKNKSSNLLAVCALPNPLSVATSLV
jgi:hypothetical protein